MEHQEVLEYIEESTVLEIGEIMDAVLDRYQILYPQWELNVFALPRERGAKRRKRFEEIVAFIRKYGGIE